MTREDGVFAWLHRWFFLGGPWDVPTYRGAKVGGHVPRVFCLPNWAHVDLKRNAEGQWEINAVYSSRAPPQPLDIITKANLRAYGLAPLGEEGTAGEARAVVVLMDQVTTSSLADLGVAPAPMGQATTLASVDQDTTPSLMGQATAPALVEAAPVAPGDFLDFAMFGFTCSFVWN